MSSLCLPMNVSWCFFLWICLCLLSSFMMHTCFAIRHSPAAIAVWVLACPYSAHMHCVACIHSFFKSLLIFVRLHMNSWIKCFQHLELDFLKEFHDICAQQGMFTAGIVNSDPHVETRIPISSVQFSSVTQSCPTLCNPMNRSTPGLPVHHHLPEFTQTHVHRVRDAIQPSQ